MRQPTRRRDIVAIVAVLLLCVSTAAQACALLCTPQLSAATCCAPHRLAPTAATSPGMPAGCPQHQHTPRLQPHLHAPPGAAMHCATPADLLFDTHTAAPAPAALTTHPAATLPLATSPALATLQPHLRNASPPRITSLRI